MLALARHITYRDGHVVYRTDPADTAPTRTRLDTSHYEEIREAARRGRTYDDMARGALKRWGERHAHHNPPD